jgi:signal transduction histidine kinase
MSFRLRLFIGVGVAVLLTAVVYGVLGYLAFKRSIDASTNESLDSFKQAVLASLDLSSSRPTLVPNDAARAVFDEYSNSRFRLSRFNRILLEFRGALPETSSDWQFETVTLDNNYRLELAFNVAENREALNSYVRTALLALPAALGLAILLAFILQRVFLRPVRDLTKATRLLSQQAMPEPVVVPPGNDELSQLAESFNRMTTSLQAFLERERSFTRYASHELRTPLSNMRVLIEGMKKGLMTPESTYPQLEETMKRMESILSGLLTLTRSVVVDLEPVMLSNVMTSVLTELPQEKRSRVRLTSQVSSIVLGRDDLIKQVLSNVLGNALKYSSDAVDVRLEETGDKVLLSVRDYGEGVPPEVLPKLTEPFFRVDKRKGGLGLGLALVKHIMASLKGDFTLTNTHPGLEATVTFFRAPEVSESKQEDAKHANKKPEEAVHA